MLTPDQEPMDKVIMWRDRPTGPGIWLCVKDRVTSDAADSIIRASLLGLNAEDLERGAPFASSRVYGPIPPDDPEQPCARSPEQRKAAANIIVAACREAMRRHQDQWNRNIAEGHPERNRNA